MDAAQARSAIGRALGAVAPGLRLPEGTDDLNLRRQLDLDSIDFLSFVEELERRTGVRVSEDDYRHLETLRQAIAFVRSRSEQVTGTA
jgi:acyl carrier protein